MSEDGRIFNGQKNSIIAPSQGKNGPIESMLPLVAKCDKIVYLYISAEEYLPSIRHGQTKPQYIRSFHCKYFPSFLEKSEAGDRYIRSKQYYLEVV
jgi:hypothetical protein